MRTKKLAGGGIALSLLVLGWTALLPASSAVAAPPALFPATPPALQVAREVSLTEAAQAGAAKLGAKGGYFGDDVSLELEGKEFKGPITVTVRVEFTAPQGKTPAELEALRELIPYDQQRAEAELNRLPNKTSKGEPVKFKLDWQWAEPDHPPSPNFDHVTIVNPLKDLPEPDKDFRSETEGLGVPNVSGDEIGAKFTATGMGMPQAMAHEMLHLAGIDDHYVDVYTYKGVDYPLPATGMEPTPLKEYLAAHKPPLPAPPAGDVRAKNMKGYPTCDIMGIGANLQCRKISRKDLDWFASQAGTLVHVKPGETLLNKSDSQQNFGVGFETIVFAAPGSTTVANGVSAYCTRPRPRDPDRKPLRRRPERERTAGLRRGGEAARLQRGLRAARPRRRAAGDAVARSGTRPTAREVRPSDESQAPPGKRRQSPRTRPKPTSAASATRTRARRAPAPSRRAGEVLPTTLVGEVEEPEIVRLDAAQLFPKRFQAGKKPSAISSSPPTATSTTSTSRSSTRSASAGRRRRNCRPASSSRAPPRCRSRSATSP